MARAARFLSARAASSREAFTLIERAAAGDDTERAATSAWLHARCLAMRYAVCWAGLVELTAQEPFAWDSLSFEAGTLGEAFRSNSKPERSGAERWVVHAAPDWSSAHRHDAPEVVARSLTEAFEEAAGQKVHTMTVHRWLYARALQNEGEAALIDSERRLGLCGDGMTGGGVEAAYISGLELAKQVEAHF